MSLYASVNLLIQTFDKPDRGMKLKNNSSNHEPLAIIGMSCRFSGSNNVDEYWDMLISGRDGITLVPDNRWTPDRIGLAELPMEKIRAGFLKCPIDEFDGKFFGMSSTELFYTDPQQRLQIEVAWEALEDAGINPSSLVGSNTGLFFGCWSQDYRELLAPALGMLKKEQFRTYMGNSHGASVGRLAYILGTVGPALENDSACSSALVAVGLGCNSLRKGDCDLAIASGVNLLLHPYGYAAMNGLLAVDGRSKPFDAAADGYVRSEGCGVIIMKRLSDALKSNDRIHAIVRGYGQSQEGPSKSFGTPTVQCEALAIQRALDDGRVNPLDVSFVEAHGTGTPVGDPIEVEAIGSKYGGKRDKPLIIGSGKGNIGHTESCSGIAGIIKTILSMKHEIIPSQAYFNEVNPKINLTSVPAIIPIKPTPWLKQPGKKRLAGVSSYGISGTDAHLILEEPPLVSNRPGITLPFNIVTFSGKSEQAIEHWASSMSDCIQRTSLTLDDVAYTANTGRAHFVSHRAAVIASDSDDLVQQLQSGSFLKGTALRETPKICFLFTGQGSQFHGMGKTLYQIHPVFRVAFDNCDQHLQDLHGISIKDTLWSEKETASLHQTIYSQTSIFVIEYSLVQLWKSWGIQPDMVVGHSLGEYAAAVTAGMISINDALRIIGARSKLIDSLPGGKMLVVRASYKETQDLLQLAQQEKTFWLDCTGINTPNQTVLGGSAENIHFFEEFCNRKQVKTHVLNATHAFHTRDMDPILNEFKITTEAVEYLTPNCTFVSSVEGRVVHVDSEYWIKHTREKVQFMEASKTAYNLGSRLFLEIGPQPILSALLTQNMEETSNSEQINCLASMKRKVNELKTLLNTLGGLYTAGCEVDWNSFHRNTTGNKVSLPPYPFERTVHWFETENTGTGKRLSGKQIHPILGCLLDNPSSNKIYQNVLQLKKLEYIRDHIIGPHVIFPGAGYLEGCLSAGYAASFGISDSFSTAPMPIEVLNLSIETPFGLGDEGCEIQTVVSPSDDDESAHLKNIEIYRQHEDPTNGRNWVRHAMSKFSQAVGNLDSSPFNIDTLKLRLTESLDIEDFYKKLWTFGIEFGPLFQSLGKVWMNSAGEGLIQVHVPDGAEDYFCHPVILDAVIQSHLVLQPPTSLAVPIFIESYVWISKPSSSINYIHILQDKAKVGKQVATLYDEDGRKLGIMSGLQFVKTDILTIRRSVESHKVHLPLLMGYTWKRDGFSLPNLPLDGQILESMNDYKQFEVTERSGSEMESYQQIYDGIALSFIKSLKELGFDPLKGQTWSLNAIMQKTRIPLTKLLFLRQCLSILTEDGYFELNSRDELNVVKTFPSEVEIISGITFNFLPTKDFQTERDLVTTCLAKLKDVLLEKDNVLGILFPSNSATSEISAEMFYNHYCPILETYTMMKNLTDYILTNRWNPLIQGTEIKLRILEIGAGTGGASVVMMELLKTHNINYKYTYTDISKAFFNKAEKKFQQFAENMDFKVFNIENDPMSQGFSPESFDLIFSSHCLHATRNMSETVNNARILLKPSGIMIVLEGFKPDRVSDATFGLVDGYWVFEDFDRRPDHCLMDEESWKTLFLESGFHKCMSLADNGHRRGVVIAEAQSQPFQYRLPRIAKQKAWLIFTDEVPGDLEEKLIKKIELTDREVIRITPRSNLLRPNSNIVSIQPHETSDFRMVLSDVRARDYILEGVVYLWGMNGGEAEQDVISQGFLSLTKALLAETNSISPRLYFTTQGSECLNDHEPAFPSTATLIGFSKSLRSEYPDMHCRCIELDPDEDIDTKVSSLFTELWQDNPEHHVFYQSGTRHVVRCKILSDKPTSLPLPTSKRYSLVLPNDKSISSLRYTPAKKEELVGVEIEVEVKAVGLIFRDIFNVLKPITSFDSENALGMDFSGIVSAVGPGVTNRKVGDHVLGIKLSSGAYGSHVKVNELEVVLLPNFFTFSDGATLGVAFFTVTHGLVTVAKLQKGETVLIHTASGGVGLVAIQLAKHIQANIITTAGSKRKRAYLRSLGLKHVFNSRDLTFGEEIKRVTDGHGVDVVLNSLTSDGFKETSLGICSRNARFVEMSKLNTWSIEEVKALRPDVEYTIIDIMELSESETRPLIQSLDNLLQKKVIHPIPYVRFDGTEVRDALSYLQKAKHIGKVVCEMPTLKLVNGQMEATSNLFNDRATYLITGGFGGIGLALAKWMVELGAKYLVLCGRSAPNDQTLKIIESIQDMGAVVVCKQVDVGSFESCKNLVDSLDEKTSGLPPLRGIQHAAGCLSDAIIPNQTWPTFQSTLNSKVNGTWNLHRLTLNKNLEHFVLYSSISAVIGSLGQSNHAAANSFMDGFATYRYLSGLPATTVNWSQWGQIGVAADIHVHGVSALVPQQGFNALEWTMKTHRVQTTVFQGDVGRWFSTWIKNILEDFKVKSDQRSSNLKNNVTFNNDQFWKEFGSLDAADREKLLQSTIVKMLSTILRLKPDDIVTYDQTFEEIGLDSLMQIELKNAIEGLLKKGGKPSVVVISESNSVRELCKNTFVLFNGNEDTDITNISDGKQEQSLDDLIQQDLILQPEIRPSGPEAVKLLEIKTVLLTGGTGTVAPYILACLTQRPSIQKVYCLVRGRTTISPKDRLLTTLRNCELLDQVDMSKVEVVDGNMGVEYLGLKSKLYETLAGEVDAVFSVGAKVNHIEMYKKSDINTSIRNVNVKGTQRLLKFAVAQRTKWVFHMSATVAITSAKTPEDWPEVGKLSKFDGLGYPLSKCISDLLIKEGMNRGIPCKVFRIPAVLGDSRSGRSQIEGNHIMLRTMHDMKAGMIPTHPVPIYSLAVDKCAYISVELFFNEQGPLGMYNVVYPHRNIYEKDMIRMVEECFGCKIKMVSDEDWMKRFLEDGEASPLFPLRDVYIKGQQLNFVLDVPDDISIVPRLTMLIPNLEELIENPITTLQRDLQFAKNKGFFAQYGI